MENLNRAAAARLARIVCEDIIRWEPDAYAEAFAAKNVPTALVDEIDAGRAIFVSRAPVFEALFDQAVQSCLIEGDFEGYTTATGGHAPKANSAAVGTVSDAVDVDASIKNDPDSGFGLARELTSVSTLIHLQLTPSADALMVRGTLEEAERSAADVVAERTKKGAWFVTMTGHLGPGPALAQLSPEEGFLSFVSKKTFGELEIGSAVVDDAYLIRATAAAVPMLRRLEDPLARLTNPAAEIRFDAEEIAVNITVDKTRDAAHSIDAILDLWSRERTARVMAS